MSWCSKLPQLYLLGNPIQYFIYWIYLPAYEIDVNKFASQKTVFDNFLLKKIKLPLLQEYSRYHEANIETANLFIL